MWDVESMEYSRDDLQERLESLDGCKRLYLMRNGYTILEQIEEIDRNEVYSDELGIDDRHNTQIGTTLSALEDLYEINLKVNEKNSGSHYNWNIDRLRKREENEILKELLEWS